MATLDEPAAKQAPPSRLGRLIEIWERLESWNEQELFLQFGDDLCSMGRYITARTFHERVFSMDGPEALVLVDRKDYNRLLSRPSGDPVEQQSSARPEPVGAETVTITMSQEEAEWLAKDLHYWTRRWGGMSHQSIAVCRRVDIAMGRKPVEYGDE